MRCGTCGGTGRIAVKLDPPPWDGAYRLVKCEACAGIGGVCDPNAPGELSYVGGRDYDGPGQPIMASVPRESHDADGRLVLDWVP